MCLLKMVLEKALPPGSLPYNIPGRHASDATVQGGAGGENSPRITSLLESLGFVVNKDKSKLILIQTIWYLPSELQRDENQAN